MAPLESGWDADDLTMPTQAFIDTGTTVFRTLTGFTINYSVSSTVQSESKKERIARIAKEKMHKSWKTYNELKPNIRLHVSNIPRHYNLNHQRR